MPWGGTTCKHVLEVEKLALRRRHSIPLTVPNPFSPPSMFPVPPALINQCSSVHTNVLHAYPLQPGAAPHWQCVCACERLRTAKAHLWRYQHLGLARTIYIRYYKEAIFYFCWKAPGWCIYGIFGREITKYTVT